MLNPDLLVGICPHDITHDPEKWTQFTSYVTSRLNLNGKFERYFSFETFSQQFKRMNFIYAHPLHAVQLKTTMGFLPLAKYVNKFDEAVIISRKSDSHQGVSSIAGQVVACVYGSPSHAAFLIDLNKNNKDISFENYSKPSYPEVAATVSSGKVPFGIILKEVWDHMQAQYPNLTTIYTTYTKQLVHVFMLSADLISVKDEVSKILMGMTSDPEGKLILSRLNSQGMEPFLNADLIRLENSLLCCKF